MPVKSTRKTPTKSEPVDERKIRAAVFREVGDARTAVDLLLQAGFTVKQITVMCSEEGKERHFRQFDHEQPAGTHTPEYAATGGAAGFFVGGLLTAGLTTAAGISLLVAGPGLLLGGAVAGTFIGAMRSRGEERTLANYYDQSLTRGDLLVAVEDDQPGNRRRLQVAEEVFNRAGAESVPLRSE
jgi:hypothetical protein